MPAVRARMVSSAYSAALCDLCVLTAPFNAEIAEIRRGPQRICFWHRFVANFAEL